MISPKEPSVAMKAPMSEKLPKGKTIFDVFADFMRYLFESTKTLFKASEPNENSDGTPFQRVSSLC